jgi:hypothetical protein
MWTRMISALKLQVPDLNQTHGTMFAPTDRVSFWVLLIVLALRGTAVGPAA